MSSNMDDFRNLFAKDPKAEYYGSVFADEEISHLIVFDAETQKPRKPVIGLNNGEFFLGMIPVLFTRRFKAVILDIFQFKNHKCSSNYEFCKIIHQKLQQFKVSHYFAAHYQLIPATILIKSNHSANIGDTLLLITMEDENDIFNVVQLEFTKNGYDIIDHRNIPFSEVTRDRIIESSKNPVAIVGWSIEPTGTAILNALLKSDNLIILNNGQSSTARIECIFEMSNWMNDKNYNKFYVTPFTAKKYCIVGGIADMHTELVAVNVDEKLPATTTVALPKIFQSYCVKIVDKNNLETLETKALDKKCHKIEITLKIDDQYFYSVTTKKIIIPEIYHLPKTLGQQKQKSKIPVIGFWDNSSVICVSKNGGNYKFLQNWNGLCGKELFINLDKKKPTFSAEQIESSKTKMNTVVYDILKIMSMPSDGIKIDKRWKFTFTENEENPVLLEFDNFDGTKKAAPPAFLMAMLLRQHFKAIQAEIGGEKKPEEIGFCLFDDFTDVERKRVEGQLQESCELLKVQCTFIKF